MTSLPNSDIFSEELAKLAEHIRERVVEVHTGERGIGSGTIWQVGPADANSEAEATIITNAHVVRATRGGTLTVRLADSSKLAATVLAIDPAHDLASLRVRASGLSPLEIGDSQALRVGELVLAVGNPFGRVGSVTAGIVEARAPADPEIALEPIEPPASQKGQEPERPGEGQRPHIELIQADVRLYPGNSGGPLVDARGRVVGINSMIGGGLAFAIPSRIVQHFLGEVQEVSQRIHLGVQALTVPLNPRLRESLGVSQETAALITAVEVGSQAEAIGLLVGDMLLALDGQTIQDAQQLPRALSRSGAARGLPATLLVARGGTRLELSLQPAAKAA